tara:strand:- start:1620 stop:3095 length:1476 start_codon:yes stop_codon:yes gene_type:complete
MHNTKKLEIIFFLSLSNLILTNYWLKLGLFSSEVRYYFYELPLVEVIIGILFLFFYFILFYFLSFFLKKAGLNIIDNLLKVILFLFVIDIIRRNSQLISLDYFYKNKFISIFILLILSILYFKLYNKFNKIVFYFFIIFSPFLLVVIFNIINFVFILNWENNKYLIKKKNYSNKNNKIVLIVFDELDFRILENDKYKSFDNVLSKSDIYSQTMPSGDATLTIVPSILTGKLLPIDTKFFDFSNNEINYKVNDKTFKLSESDHIFKILNKQNYKIGIIGTYHRYCNIFYSYLNQCYELNDEQYSIKNIGLKKYLIYSVIDILPANTKIKIFEKINTSNFNKEDHPKLRIENIKKYLKYFPTLIENNDFIFIHVALPHAPWIYSDGKINIYKYDQFGQAGYYENMIFTDIFLSKIVDQLKKLNQFENSYLILASDHGWRSGDNKFVGSNKKKLKDRAGDILLSVKKPYQKNKVIISKRTYNHHVFNLINDFIK